ncbi:MAG: 30S ribosomal protein S8 [Candidatus Liptonbacteria bacterium RIFCSPLOWO2_01_FULL_52_25]|uniref:Small ribosomal subunit protein uS8 n=1 Tax=Candidatus Liptonbacteria bacterium RIFCSPLOWO2_01_FULL_52_25 TaxID=1798650 RepID=A0A1G2CD01_9BACT|nr:MAG: 30S ribosomal protein S8 [Candidatus Liptonbacteria bacterium RIFCSPLOWO2_01_FULL_52_25]
MYYDLLARIQNAERAGKESVIGRFSKLSFAVARILKDEGYVGEVHKKSVGKLDHIEIRLLKGAKARAITGFKIISKPSRRLYVTAQNLRSVRQGHGTAVISTSKGVMTGKEAKKNNIGGEYLFEVW